MKDDREIEPVDPSLGALFAAERTREGAPAGAAARALARLAVALPGPPGNGDGGGGSGGGDGGASGGPGAGAAVVGGTRLAPIVLAFLVGGGAGAGIHAALAPRGAPARIEAAAVASAVPEPTARPSAAAPADPMPSASVAASAPVRPPPRPVDSSDLELAAERAVLDVARTALGRGDGAHALEAVERHARSFPRGQLSEEREAIAVQALVKAGRRTEAGQRGARFRVRYPTSVLRPVIDAALGPDGGEP